METITSLWSWVIEAYQNELDTMTPEKLFIIAFMLGVSVSLWGTALVFNLWVRWDPKVKELCEIVSKLKEDRKKLDEAVAHRPKCIRLTRNPLSDPYIILAITLKDAMIIQFEKDTWRKTGLLPLVPKTHKSMTGVALLEEDMNEYVLGIHTKFLYPDDVIDDEELLAAFNNCHACTELVRSYKTKEEAARAAGELEKAVVFRVDKK